MDGEDTTALAWAMGVGGQQNFERKRETGSKTFNENRKIGIAASIGGREDWHTFLVSRGITSPVNGREAVEAWLHWRMLARE